MNEPYNQIPNLNLFGMIASHFKKPEKPYDFGEAVYIKEWQLEIPYGRNEHFVAAFKRKFPELVPSTPLMILGNDTLTLYNGLVLHFVIVDRNKTFRNASTND